MNQKRHLKLHRVQRPQRQWLHFIVGLITAAALIAAVAVPTEAAARSKRGEVVCAGGESPVVGVWVKVRGGTSGWATLSNKRGHKANWSYDTQGKKYQLHIGCGGTPQRWETNTRTGWTRHKVNATVVMHWLFRWKNAAYWT